MTNRRLLLGSSPALLPSGIVTVGSIATIVNDSLYHAWPVLGRTPNGKPILGWTQANSHHLDNSGKGVAKTAASDADAAAGTWGSTFDVYDDASKFVSFYGVMSTSAGRCFASLWRDTALTAATGQAGFAYTDDPTGMTGWSAWQGITNGFTQDCYVPGPFVEFDGELYAIIEGNNSGQTELQNSCHLMKSPLDGSAFADEATIRNYVTDSLPCYESQIVALGGPRFLIVHRTAATYGESRPHRTQVSRDGLATFDTPATAFPGLARPSAIKTSRGVIIVGTRNESGAFVVFTSVNGGRSWIGPTSVDATMFEMEYSSFLELDDGSVLAAYGSQPTSSTSNGDIKTALLAVA